MAETEKMHTGEFLLSEANGTLSREGGKADGAIAVGELVVTNSAGSWAPWSGTGSADGVALTAAADNAKVTVIARYAEVKGDALNLPNGKDADDAAVALDGTGIMVR